MYLVNKTIVDNEKKERKFRGTKLNNAGLIICILFTQNA